jgi:hypothetical protein
MNKIITSLDLYSTKVHFTINSGSKRNKTPIGGIITICSSLVIIAITIILLIEFVTGNNSTVQSSSTSTEDLRLPLYDYPFLLRLSTEKIIPYEEGSRLYTMTLKLKVGGGKNTYQWTDDIVMEQCDINQHFGNFSYLFANISDLNTYLCPIIRQTNQSVVGIYGGTQLFQYYHFYITMCINSTLNNNHCVDNKTMNKLLKATYLDVLTIDYNLDITNSRDKPFKPYVRSDRHSISNTVYKRVWMYMENIDYIKDIGLLFEKDTMYSFYQVNSFKYDMDLRDIYNGVTIPGTFANLSILNFNIKQSYIATYMKVQEFIAYIWSLSNVIKIFAIIVNYCFSESSYKQKIIGYVFPKENEKNYLTTGLKKTQSNMNMNSMNKYVLNLQTSQSFLNHKTSNFNKNIVINGKNTYSNSMTNTKKLYQTQLYNPNKSGVLLLSPKSSIENSNINVVNEKPKKNKTKNVFDRLMTKLLFSQKNKQIYYDNYHLFEEILDIKFYLHNKYKLKQIDEYLRHMVNDIEKGGTSPTSGKKDMNSCIKDKLSQSEVRKVNNYFLKGLDNSQLNQSKTHKDNPLDAHYKM